MYFDFLEISGEGYGWYIRLRLIGESTCSLFDPELDEDIRLQFLRSVSIFSSVFLECLG